jgi:long-chain fatty acid transport protein
MKKQRQVVAFAVCMLLGFAFFCARAYAGGIALYEVGPSQTALASAGWASRADDASTLFTNPAGMTRLKQSEFLGGIQPLYTDLKFSPDGRTTTAGSSGSTRQIIPTGDLYYVHNVSPDLKLGIGVLGYFGLGLDYGHYWVGRYM